MEKKTFIIGSNHPVNLHYLHDFIHYLLPQYRNNLKLLYCTIVTLVLMTSYLDHGIYWHGPYLALCDPLHVSLFVCHILILKNISVGKNLLKVSKNNVRTTLVFAHWDVVAKQNRYAYFFLADVIIFDELNLLNNHSCIIQMIPSGQNQQKDTVEEFIFSVV